MRRGIFLAGLASLFLAAGCATATLSETDLTDAGIRARVERALAAHRELDLRAITLDVHLKVVTLSGTVPSWGDKRTIQQVLNALPGIDQLVVNIVVPE